MKHKFARNDIGIVASALWPLFDIHQIYFESILINQMSTLKTTARKHGLKFLVCSPQKKCFPQLQWGGFQWAAYRISVKAPPMEGDNRPPGISPGWPSVQQNVGLEDVPGWKCWDECLPIFMVNVGKYTRWNKPLILTIDPDFLAHMPHL